MKTTNRISKIAISEASNIIPSDWYLYQTKQINCFIGANNSGKSRFIRNLSSIDFDRFSFEYDYLSTQKLLELTKAETIKPTARTHLFKFEINRLSGRFFASLLEEVVEKNPAMKIHDLKGLVSAAIEQHFRRTNNVVNLNEVSESKKEAEAIIDRAVSVLISSAKPTVEHDLSHLKWERLYIPTLRTLRHVASEDILLTRTKSDYFGEPAIDTPKIFTGHSLYEDLKKHLLGSHEQRRTVREYEEYLSRSFFFGQPITIVPRIDADVVYFKEGDKQERPIYDLGDGIQSIIVLTFPVFMAEKPTMFFIEEPEHYLHAGLQRTLIETLASFEEHMFFMTTHSNHFLDIAQERDDVSVQHVRREGDETIISPSTKHAELLTDLGVRASSVLLANCSIWVEGITDKLYLRTYIEKYLQELKSKDSEREAKLRSYHENLHYVFTEYQGSNITHWDFGDDLESNSQTPARKLSNNIMLIADADIDGKGDRTNQLETALGDNFELLEWKEIENYIPHNILIDTAKRRWDTFNGKKESTIERFSNIQEGIFEHETHGIGRILERYVDKKPTSLERKFYSDDSGTIKDKVKFCRTAVEIMNDPETQWELTPQLSSLCEKIWDFIEKHN
ncbi:AAA family ATPase [Enterovibrio baiacu]|uniref:AAA family ATPase n=1 Tax=Enterovibrio baiacu TaxID=2491023 RepID=UPI0010138915|nr:ATP-binding protein [Enterovibrio baiacu]MBE1275641.1 ATP-binding protein [Enterovibrio baiacu]